LILGSARPALIVSLSLSIICDGVFLGAPTPNQALASKPGTKSRHIWFGELWQLWQIVHAVPPAGTAKKHCDAMPGVRV